MLKGLRRYVMGDRGGVLKLQLQVAGQGSGTCYLSARPCSL